MKTSMVVRLIVMGLSCAVGCLAPADQDVVLDGEPGWTEEALEEATAPMCDNPAESATLCLNDIVCYCHVPNTNWPGEFFGPYPAGHVCSEPGRNCVSLHTTADKLTQCVRAEALVDDPAGCAFPDCRSSGITKSRATNANCCTITKTRNCLPRTAAGDDEAESDEEHWEEGSEPWAEGLPD